MARGGFPPCRGCSPHRGTPPELGKIRGQGQESTRGGCRGCRLPTAAPPQRQRGSSLNYPPCPGKAAGVGQRWVQLFGVGREHPSSQPQRWGLRQAGSKSSHRYFHTLTSALLPAGGLFSKSNGSVSAKGWAVPHPSQHSPGGCGEGLTKPSLGMKKPNLPRDSATVIPGAEGCCQTAADALQSRRWHKGMNKRDESEEKSRINGWKQSRELRQPAATSPPQPLTAQPGDRTGRGTGFPALLVPRGGSALPSQVRHPVPSCHPRAQPGSSSPPPHSWCRRLRRTVILWPRHIFSSRAARRGKSSGPEPLA